MTVVDITVSPIIGATAHTKSFAHIMPRAVICSMPGIMRCAGLMASTLIVAVLRPALFPPCPEPRCPRTFRSRRA